MDLNINQISKILLNKELGKYDFYSIKDEILFSVNEDIMNSFLITYIKTYQSSEEQLRELAAQRLQNLRNLSFSLMSEDKSNEFENVPAYLRSSLEIYKNASSADVFYGKLLISDLIEEHREQVFIYFPAKDVSLVDAEDITNACGDFMESLGYELETENEPIFGSFLQNIWFKIKKGSKITKEEVIEDFKKGKKALELQYVELPTAEQTEKLANSAAKIVELLDKQEEGVVRLGALLVLKKKVDGKSKIIIQQLTTEIILILDQKPQLLQNLQTVYELITGDVKGIKQLDETDTGTEVSG